MKRFNWRDLTEIIGFIAIVGSLIFVGLQLNQSQEIAIASQYQDRASTAVEYYGSQMQSEQVFFVMLDNFHYQYSAGFMEEESWEAFRRQLRDELSRESTAAYYQDYGLSLRISFEVLCDEILQEIEADIKMPAH